MSVAVLTILKKYHDRYVSGEDISAKLKVSRTAIWKEIQGLRDLGYQIEAFPHLGYRLTDIPDKLFADEIGYELKTQTIGRKIISYESLDSTNDAVRKFGQDGLAEGVCVFAEAQRKGRGRLGRSWLSPRGKGILVSFLLRPPITLGQISGMTLMVAISAVKAVLTQTGVVLGIKWPNDLIYHDQKVGGILTEIGAEADRLNFAVVGLGLNANGAACDLPKGSISLREIAGKEIARVE
ncbi:MAG: biotin--[acetyl-CoA-carboxylase] ligase, partial [Candidatus Omnitrophota bacterium]